MHFGSILLLSSLPSFLYSFLPLDPIQTCVRSESCWNENKTVQTCWTQSQTSQPLIKTNLAPPCAVHWGSRAGPSFRTTNSPVCLSITGPIQHTHMFQWMHGCGTHCRAQDSLPPGLYLQANTVSLWSASILFRTLGRCRKPLICETAEWVSDCKGGFRRKYLLISVYLFIYVYIVCLTHFHKRCCTTACFIKS